MKNAVKKVLKVLAIGVTAAVLGHILAGCDSGGEQDVAGGDASATKVDTGTTVINPCDSDNVLIVSSSPEAAAKLCVGWSAAKVYGSVAACVTALSATMPAATAQAECATSMTAAQCADYEHYFVDSAGVQHGYGIGTQGDYTVLKYFGILDIAIVCKSGQKSPAYCSSRGLYGTCFFKGCP